jgi:hypothetical protein
MTRMKAMKVGMMVLGTLSGCDAKESFICNQYWFDRMLHGQPEQYWCFETTDYPDKSGPCELHELEAAADGETGTHKLTVTDPDEIDNKTEYVCEKWVVVPHGNHPGTFDEH